MAKIKTDKYDYAPGSTVLFTAYEYAIGATVQFLSQHVKSSWYATHICNAVDQNFVLSTGGAQAHEIVVVDTSIQNYQRLLEAISPNTEILYLDPAQDGVKQIADFLEHRNGISALHILSHGSQGSIKLGTSLLNSNSLNSYQAQLEIIGHALTKNGDILFYGCNVANGDVGIDFISQLAAITNADIAASDDLTGNAAKGGDWTLEHNAGIIDATSLVAQGFQGVLAATTISSIAINSTPAAASTYAVGESITARVTFSAAETVTGTPTLTLNIGGVLRTATYSSGSGTTALTFKYITHEGDVDADGISIDANPIKLNGGTIISTATPTAATLTYAGLANQASDKVASSATGSNVSSISISSTPANVATGYVVGETVQATVTFTAAETVTGTPSLDLQIGDNIRTATYVSGSGTANLVFKYVIAAGDKDTDGIAVVANSLAVNTGSINSSTGVAAIITHATVPNNAADKVAVTADATAPILHSAVGAGSAITLSYDELGSGLNADTVPDVGRFSFIRNGGVGGQLSVTGVTIDHNAQTVTLRLSGPINSTDTDLKISYTANGTNDVQDVAGNKAANLANVFVDNTMPSFDIEGQRLAFNTPEVIVGTSGRLVGDKVLYRNAITVDGQSIDVIVTTTALTNMTITSADNAPGGGTITPALTGATTQLDLDWYKLNTNVTGANGNAQITFNFIKGGSYSASNPTGDGVILQNVYVNSYDIDSGASATTQQFQEFGGFAYYTVASGTKLNQTQLSGFTRFQADPSVTTNITAAPGTATGDLYRVQALYTAIDSFSIKTGMLAAGTAYYYIDFSKGPNWAVPVVSYDIPTVDPKTTTDTTPDLTGTFVGTVTGNTDQAYKLTITVNGVTYTAGETAGERTTLGNGDIQLLDATTGLKGVYNPTTGVGTWSMTVPTALPLATYPVAATVYYGPNLAGATHTSTDATTNELVITSTPVETVRPTLTSIERLNPTGQTITTAGLTIQNYVDFKVTFSEAVANIDVSDFQITGTASTGSAITSVTQSGSNTYTVRVANIPTSNTGDLDLNLLLTNDLVDLVGNFLDPSVGGTGAEGVLPTSTIDETYLISTLQNISFAISATPTISEETAGVTTFTLTMTGGTLNASNTATVNIARSGTSTDGTDYSQAFLTALDAAMPTGVTRSGNTLTFTSAYIAGPISFTMTATNDATADNNETIIGTLSNATITNGTATITTPSATTTITDKDVGFAITATPTISEEGAGVTTFSVTMNGAQLTAGTATVTVTGSGTATGSTDYSGTFAAAFAAATLPTGVTRSGSVLTFGPTYVPGTAFNFSMTATNDQTADPNETIIGTLSTPTATGTGGAASITTASATTTITDLDQAISFAISATPTISEDTAGVTTFMLTMSGGTLNASNTATVNIARTGTSTDGTDYSQAFLTALDAALPTGVTRSGNTLTFTSAYNAATPINFSMTATNDQTPDNAETIIATLTSPTITNGTASITTASATTTITDKDVNFAITATPTISEETAGVTTFSVTMTGAQLTAGNTATINVARDAASTSTDGTDYSSAFATAFAAGTLPSGVTRSGSVLTFGPTYVPGTAFNFSMTATNDAIADNGETIIGTLSSPTNTGGGSATITTPSATTTITDKDVGFAITATPTISEEGAGVTTFSVTMNGVQLTAGTATVTVTGSGSATGGTDYSGTFAAAFAAATLPTGVTRSGSVLTFGPTYVPGTPFNFSMTATNDQTADPNETIIGTLSTPTASGTGGAASITTASATTTITDLDQAISFAISATPTISEDTAGVTTFVLTMTGGTLNASNTAHVDITRSGTSTDGTDYSQAFLTALDAALPTGVTRSGNTLTFTSSYNPATPISFTMTATNDTIADNNETIIGTLSNATINNGTATITTPSATTTITDLDKTISGNVKSDLNNDNTGDINLAGITVELKTADGLTVLQTTTTDANGDYSFDVAPGVYRVDETDGVANPNDVSDKDGGNLDQISVDVTSANSTGNDFVDEPQHTISGNVKADTNNDNTGDANLAGISIALKTADGLTVLQTTTTDANGDYNFDVAPGVYRVDETDGVTNPNDVSDKDGGNLDQIAVDVTSANSTGNDFVDEPQRTISGNVKADTNNDNTGDANLAGISIALKTADGLTVLQTTTTDAGGNYSFSAAPGTYRVDETNSGNYPADVSDKDGAGNSLNAIAVDVTSANSTGNDFVDKGTSSVSGVVRSDIPNNGALEGDEPALAGATVRLLDAGGFQVGSDVITAADGSYSFVSLAAGNYTVIEVNPAGYNDVTDFDGTGNSANTIAVILTAGQNLTGQDFLDVGVGSITGVVRNDIDHDGVIDGTDTPLAGAVIQLQTPAGVQVAGTTNITTGSDGSYSFTGVAAGDYKVVEITNPAGYTDVTDFDGTGNTANTIAVTLPAGQNLTSRDFLDVGVGAITGVVRNDSDHDNVIDVTDSPLAGAVIQLQTLAGVQVAGTTNITTGADGSYSFTNVAAGDYKVVEITNPTGYIDVTDADAGNANSIAVTVTANQTLTGQDFLEKSRGTIGDQVWEDLNHNGIQDNGENGIANVLVKLLDSNGVFTGTSVTTDSNGNYLFETLAADSYKVQVIAPNGYFFTTANQGTDNLDSDVDAAGISSLITVTTGDILLDWDAGLYRKASIGDKVWFDRNKNGLQDIGEGGIGNVKVTLKDAGGNDLSTVTTNASGNYQFNNVDPGTYSIQFDKTLTIFNGISFATSKYTWGPKDAGIDDTIDSDAAALTLNIAKTDNFAVTSGQNDLSQDAAVTPIVIDLNGDGIHTIARADSQGLFDLFGTGTAIESGWISAEDAFLVVDHNSNGKIDDISEMFGGLAKGDGFAKLTGYDSNNDGAVNASDTDFGKLQVWRDANGNHQADAGELMSLANTGLTSLSVNYSEQPFLDAQNNLHLERSSATLSDGSAVEMTDVYFNVSAADASAAGVSLPNFADLLGNSGLTNAIPWMIVDDESDMLDNPAASNSETAELALVDLDSTGYAQITLTGDISGFVHTANNGAWLG